MIVQYLLDPGGDGGGVNIPGVPGTKVNTPSKDGVLDGTAKYGQALAPLIAIVVCTVLVVLVARWAGDAVKTLVEKGRLIIGLGVLLAIGWAFVKLSH